MQTALRSLGSQGRKTTWIRIGTVVASFAMTGLLVISGSQAAFNDTTSNGGSSLSTGSVDLADDDSGTVLFNLSDLMAGATATKCVNVTYTGSLTADVKLYGSVGGTGLASYVDTVIDIGSGAAGGATLSCTGFSSSSNLHTGTLAAFGTANTDYSNGLGGFSGATNPTTKSYRVQVTIQDNNNAQDKNASFTFTWEAQNV